MGEGSSLFSIFRDYASIPSEARFLIYISFVPSIVFGFLYTDLSYFLHNVQGLSDLWMGITITVMAMTLVALSLPLGILADRYGRKKMLIVGNIMASLSLVGFALTTNLAVILLTAVIEGIGEAGLAVSGSALLADNAGDDKRTLAFSLIAFLGWVAGAIGASAPFSVNLLQNLSLSVAQAHSVLFLLIGIIGVSMTPLAFRIREPVKFSPVAKRHELLPRKSGKILVRFSFCSILVAAGAGMFVPLMTRWFSAAYMVTDAVSGPVLGVSSVSTAVAVFAAPKLASRFGLVRAIVFSQSMSTFFMVLVPTSPTFAIAAVTYSVRVFLMNLSNPLNQSLIMGLVSPDERGMASGVSASLWRLPNALTTTVGAYWIGIGYLALPFYVATVLYVTSITSFWFLFKNTRLPEESRLVQPVPPAVVSEELPPATPIPS